MFHAHRVGCKSAVKEGSNELVLTFHAPFTESKKEEAANGGPMTLCEWFEYLLKAGADGRVGNGNSGRLYSRKAQYGWGEWELASGSRIADVLRLGLGEYGFLSRLDLVDLGRDPLS